MDKIVYLLIGLGDVSDKVKSDLGRIAESEMNYDRVLQEILNNRMLDRVSSQFKARNSTAETAENLLFTQGAPICQGGFKS